MIYTLHYSPPKEPNTLIKKPCLSKAAAFDMARKVLREGGKPLAIRDEYGAVATAADLEALASRR